MTKSTKLNRRSALKGLGVSLALPWLETTTANSALASAGSATAPKRLAFFFVPNGVNPYEWTPKQTGYGYDLTSILEPIARVKDDVNVLTGLTQNSGRANGDGAGDHARSASTFLTGCQPKKTSGGNIHVGVSVDQVAARTIGHQTRFPSLELGCDRSRDSGNCDSGYSCAYSHNISWASANRPVAKEIDPRQVFERMFGDQLSTTNREAAKERLARRRSILDYVGNSARQVQEHVSQNDRRKLEQYLDSIRQIERRIEHSDRVQQEIDLDPQLVPDGVPEEFGEHIRLMMDMLVLAFQTDQTRIATCMFASAGSNRSYRNIDVPDGHHDLSHHGGDRTKLEKIRLINHFHVEQFAYFLERLKSIPEGDSNLLDHSMIVYGSGLNDGNRHNNENLPILLAGRGGGQIETGRHIRYSEETPLNNLFLSLLDRVGAPVEGLGDSTGRLPGLS